MRNAFSGVERALFWTLVFATFAAAAAGLGARAVDRLAVRYESQRSSYLIVRVVAPEGPVGISAAEMALANSPLVSSAAPMTARRAAQLLRDWGGTQVPEGELNNLRLIEVELSPDHTSPDVVGDLRAALSASAVTADVIPPPTVSSGGGVAARVRIAAMWGALAFAAVMALIVSLAARGLAARRRELVTVLADIGATRSQAAGRVADEASVIGLYAGLLGGVLAGVAGLLVMLAALPDATLQSLPSLLWPIDYAPIVAAPLVAAIAAGFGARAAAGHFHAQAARLG